VLSGLLGLAGRGTVAQSIFATFVAFFYFAMVFHQRPYKNEALNMIKIFSEVQIFGVLVICVVLQTYDNDFSREPISIDDWGMVLTILTLAIIPVAVYMVYKSANDVFDEKKEDGTAGVKTTNPMLGEADMSYTLD
jgi:magnesium-transporting ATPase (P-type)